MLFVLSAPSGSGKTTIARRVLPMFASLSFSVSATTRARRPRETDGVDYHFLTVEDFLARVKAEAFAEWEEIFGCYYGTLRSEIDRANGEGRHLLFDVDVKGALSIKQSYPEDSVLVFIKPPDLDTLRQRLEHRGSESQEIIERRISRAAWELEQASLFDHVVVNDDLARSVPLVASLIAASIEDHVVRTK